MFVVFSELQSDKRNTQDPLCKTFFDFNMSEGKKQEF